MAATATKKPLQKSLARLVKTTRKGEAWIIPNQARAVVCRLKGQCRFKPQMQQGQSQVWPLMPRFYESRKLVCLTG